jgi:hypothetical protein
MALESIQPLTEMSTRNLPGGIWRPARKSDSLTAICEPIAQPVTGMFLPSYAFITRRAGIAQIV